jgi:GntR family transcriptional regulator/MocR family aminotransferase
MAEGHFDRHIRRMRMLYADRQAALIDAVTRRMGEALRLEPHPAGLHLVGMLPTASDDIALAARAAEHNVEAQALSVYYHCEEPQPGFVLGYAVVPPRSIRAAVGRLADALAD